MIPDDFKQTLLARVDIVDVIERHVQLRKAGINYSARCPFHSEKTPSFTVSPSKQFYHCFGCGAHGNAITFLMEYGGMGYIDAVRELATGVGMPMPQFRPEPGKPAGPAVEDLADVLLKAARFYKDELKRAPQAIAYLKQRGLTGEIAARFGIGYAPAGWQALAALFPDYESKLLADAGLVIAGEGGKRYDRFRDRIMFPILDGRGRVIGFGGRVLDGGEPKYLNSPETPLFEKGRELYGLPQARQALRESGRIVVVEGYMDVVALAQHGIGYAVATLGTATTAAHVQKLLRQTDEIVFCFDGDAAGRRAAWRALEASVPLVADDKRVAFLFLPPEDDPDSFVRTHGADAFGALLRDALPLSGFLLRELSGQVDLATEEGRARLLHVAKPLVAGITAPGFSRLLRKRLAETARITDAELDELYQINRPSQRPQAPARAPRAAPVGPYRRVLRGLLTDPAWVSEVEERLLVAADPDARAAAALVRFVRETPGLTPASVMARATERFRDEPEGGAILRAAGDLLGVEEGIDIAAEFRSALGGLADTYRRNRMRELELGGLRTDAEKAEYRQLTAERAAAQARSGGSTDARV
jgi:DNA primase